jgi:hypothetical protein
MIARLTLIAILTAGSLLASNAEAQQNCVQYHLVPHTIYEKKPVTRYRTVNETSYETKRVTEQVPVYSTEKRERVTVSYEPETTTEMQDEYYEVLRPVEETKYRTETWEETEYEKVTEMREREYLVEKPVTETRYKTERVLVRKPVRKTEMRIEDVTTYRPVERQEMEYVPGAILTNQWVQAPGSNRSRLERLERGYYWDSESGKYVFRRGGLHWTNPGNAVVNQQALTPALIPQERSRTTLLAETTRREKPVEVIEYDERIEVRKVPVEVETTERRYETRKVPVEVEKPIRRTRSREIPYTQTRMERVTKVRRVPIEKTVLRRVEKVEPYEKVTARWVNKTREVQVPKTVAKRVPYTVMENVPRTVWMKVPMDAFGNVLGNPIPIESKAADAAPTIRETFDREVRAADSAPSVLEKETTETSQRTESSKRLPFERMVYDRPVQSPKRVSQSPDDAIIVPTTEPDAENPETSLIRVTRKPVVEGEGSGSELEETAGTSDRTVEDEPVRIFPNKADSSADESGDPTPIEGTFEPAKSDTDSSNEEPSDSLDDDMANADPVIG